MYGARVEDLPPARCVLSFATKSCFLSAVPLTASLPRHIFSPALKVTCTLTARSRDLSSAIAESSLQIAAIVLERPMAQSHTARTRNFATGFVLVYPPAFPLECGTAPGIHLKLFPDVSLPHARRVTFAPAPPTSHVARITHVAAILARPLRERVHPFTQVTGSIPRQSRINQHLDLGDHEVGRDLFWVLAVKRTLPVYGISGAFQGK
mmetsp:Transcript_60160/g.160131  ORF Transcript_60160/g.160131 Transcript_60160/m.160131 type:complete len:208 (-) Transcript_60160:262-885(-)